MTKRILPTPEQLRELLRYEPETGRLFWLPRPESHFQGKGPATTWNKRFSGKEAFSTKHKQGYLCGVIHYQKVLAHRVAWAVYHGEWPKNQIDHINGVKTDNRIENLRAATHAQNLHNMGPHSRGGSGYKGVSFDGSRNLWMARLMVNRKQLNLGRFGTPEAAHAAYCEAAKKYHGEFARTS